MSSDHDGHDGAPEDCPSCALARIAFEEASQAGDRETGSEPLLADQPPEREFGS